jgi:surface antigen
MLEEAEMSKSASMVLLIGAAFAAITSSAAAGSPPWVPAWGWQARHQDEEVARAPAVAAQPAYADPFGIAAGSCSREALGKLVGAGAGASIGSDPSLRHRAGNTIAIGMAGALVGGAVGRSMDELDQGCVGQVLEYADTGRTIAWRNPGNNETYTIAPLQTYRATDGRFCREFTVAARIAGRPEQAYGAACRQPDGSWQPAN